MTARKTRIAKLRKAVDMLDDMLDGDWLTDGRPRMKAVEAYFDDTSPTRAEVDAMGRLRAGVIAGSLPTDTSEDEPPASPAPVQTATIGRIVIVTVTPTPSPLGSEPFKAAGIVAKVDDDGALNIKVFDPWGGADGFYTGVRPTEYVDAMIDGADKNSARAATWDWPPRDEQPANRLPRSTR